MKCRGVAGIAQRLDGKLFIGALRFLQTNDIGLKFAQPIDQAILPPAQRVSFEQMASTMEDSQRVEVEGIVRKVFKKRNRLYIEVATEGGRVTGRIPFYTKDSLPLVVDARVRMR